MDTFITCTKKTWTPPRRNSPSCSANMGLSSAPSHTLFYCTYPKVRERHVRVKFGMYVWTPAACRRAGSLPWRCTGCSAPRWHHDSTSCACISLINSVALRESPCPRPRCTSGPPFHGSSYTADWCSPRWRRTSQRHVPSAPSSPPSPGPGSDRGNSCWTCQRRRPPPRGDREKEKV